MSSVISELNKITPNNKKMGKGDNYETTIITPRDDIHSGLNGSYAECQRSNHWRRDQTGRIR